MTDKLELELRREIAELRGRIANLEPAPQLPYYYPWQIPYTAPVPWHYDPGPTCGTVTRVLTSTPDYQPAGDGCGTRFA